MKIIPYFAIATLMFTTTSFATPADLPPTLMDTLNLMVECLHEDTPEKAENCAEKAKKESPNWKIYADSDLITDDMVITMSPTFTGGEGVAKLDPGLIISCGTEGIIMMISGKFKVTDDTSVTTRIDSGAPSSSIWRAGTTGNSLLTTNVDAMSALVGSRTAIFRFRHGNGETATARFDVSEFDEASRWLEEYCAAWKPKPSSP